MNELAYHRLSALACTPEARELATEYLAAHLGQFLKKRDKVLICFADHPSSVGSLMKEAVRRCGAEPLFLDGDSRWLTLLKTAFITRCDAIVGPPMTLLGLAKVAKHMATPLFARNVLIGGYPSRQWMIEGIQHGLDCRVWSCYDPGLNSMIAGFSCPAGYLHLRDQRFRVQIQDAKGRELPAGQAGRVVLSPVFDEALQFDTGDVGRLEAAACGCGCQAPRLMDLHTSNGIDPAISQLWESIHYWSSILDCKVLRTAGGLELELVVFPGEKLPKLPSCAKLLVRSWNPETDEPFPHAYMLKNWVFSQETH